MWLQSIMSRTASRRRPQSKSPASSTDGSRRSGSRTFFACKNKKRRSSSSTKDRSLTEEESFYSDTSSSAAWRVQNIRSGAPTENDWWKRDDGERDGNAFRLARTQTGRPRSAPQVKRGNFVIVDSDGNGSAHEAPIRFHNCGLETWEQARAEWKKQTVDVVPPKPEPPRQHELAKALAKSSNARTYQLPQRMALPDLVKTYQEVWYLSDRDY